MEILVSIVFDFFPSFFLQLHKQNLRLSSVNANCCFLYFSTLNWNLFPLKWRTQPMLVSRSEL